MTRAGAQIVDAYWRSGVTERGYYITGGQTNGEVWSPPNALSARLGFRTQEHCTVYNMMRLADYLLRWSDDPRYADYWERNLWNGILAQQHPDTGMIAYFLPLHAGAEKVWGTPTDDFWCCHGSLVQAHTMYADNIWFEHAGGLTLSQYIPSELDLAAGWRARHRASDARRPAQVAPPARQPRLHRCACKRTTPVEFSLRLRIPWWVSGAAQVSSTGTQPVAKLSRRAMWRSGAVWSLTTRCTLPCRRRWSPSRCPTSRIPTASWTARSCWPA